MRLRLTNCEILDPSSGERFWGFVEVEDGKIKNVGRSGPGLMERPNSGTRVIDGKGHLLTPSFVDLFADFCEPGNEHREDIQSGSKAAAAGGYTAVFVSPETTPVCDSADTARFIMERSKECGLVEVRPHAATSKDLSGKGLPELGELAETGVCSVSSGDRYENDSGFLRRVMEYAANFGLRVVLTCQEPGLAGSGVVHESPLATMLGLPGVPATAEEVAVARHIALCRLTRVPVHLAKISSAASVHLLREAKALGIPVSASVSALHLLLTEEAASGYDTNAKLLPPLRSSEDRLALLAALEDGTIDAVVSDHKPVARQEKEVEFERAIPGASTIEVTFSVLNTIATRGEVSLLAALRTLCVGPRKVMGLEGGKIAVGQPADLVLLDRSTEWVLAPEMLLSRGKNSPLIGQRLVGRPVLTMKVGRVTWDLQGIAAG